MNPILDPDAEREILDATLWYEGQQAGLGDDFRAAVDKSLTHIRDNPLGGPLLETLTDEPTIRRVMTKRFPYLVIYDCADPQQIRVLAVTHERRRPNYWLGPRRDA